MDCSPPGSSIHGIFQARILEWVAMPFSRGSPWPRDWTPHLLHLLLWQADTLPTAPLGKPIRCMKSMLCMYTLMKKKIRLLNCMRAQIMSSSTNVQCLRHWIQWWGKRDLCTPDFLYLNHFSPIQIFSSSFFYNSHPNFTQFSLILRAQLSLWFLHEAYSEIWAWTFLVLAEIGLGDLGHYTVIGWLCVYTDTAMPST